MAHAVATEAVSTSRDGPVGCYAMSSHVDPPCVVALSNHPQLFLDEHTIGRINNLARRVQHPAKFVGNPILTAEHPWEQRHLYRPSVIYEPDLGRFRMHYTTIDRPTPEAPKGISAKCYAESEDGFHWHKPLTNAFPFDDRPSNIVAGGPAHGIRTPLDPQRPYVAVLQKVGLGTAFSDRGIAVASSTDGLAWRVERRITDTKCDTVPSIVWHEPVGKYFVYTRAQARHPKLDGHLRVTGVMESHDFEHWTPKQAVNLITEAEGFPYVQAHALTAHAYGDVLVAEVPLFYLEEPGNNFLCRCDIQLATSRDGWHWDRVAGGQVFLPHGPDDWDRWYVHSTSMTRKDDTLYFFYNGRPQKHGALRQLREQGATVDTQGPESMIGVATLPADRFAALELRDTTQPGIIDTPPVRFNGRELLINAAIDPDNLQVELIDEQGPTVQFQSKPLPGFEAEHARLVRHDALRFRVVWSIAGTERSLGDAPHDRPLIIRFQLRRGQLFAFQIQ